MRSFTLAVCLVSMPVLAQVTTRALIWGGGATPEAAAAALKNFEDTPAAKALFDFAAGYPKVVESASVAGLKSGFHVVLLGVCGADEAQLALGALKALQPQVYARPVQLTERNCPKLKPDWKPETKRDGALSATMLVGPYGRWMFLVGLNDAGGELIDFKAVSDADCQRGADQRGWSLATQTAVVSYVCYQAGCTAPDETEVSDTFTVVKKRLKQKTESGDTRRGACD